MSLTSLEIYSIVEEWVKSSSLGDEVHNIYIDDYPKTPSNRSIKGEFIVINVLTNAIEDEQVSTVNLNLYVPDVSIRMNAVAQRQPDTPRLKELTRVAYDSLKGYPTFERWYFDVSSEVILREEGIPYSFASIKLTFKKY